MGSFQGTDATVASMPNSRAALVVRRHRLRGRELWDVEPRVEASITGKHTAGRPVRRFGVAAAHPRAWCRSRHPRIRCSTSTSPTPYVLAADDGYRAFATNSRGLNVPTAASDDLSTWTQVGDALPDLPTWAEARLGVGAVGAPGRRRLRDVRDGRRPSSRPALHLRRARATPSTGPYTLSDQPIVCGTGGIHRREPVDGCGRVVVAHLEGRTRQRRTRADSFRPPHPRWPPARDGTGHAPEQRRGRRPRQRRGPVVGPRPRTATSCSSRSVTGRRTTYRTGYATCASPSGPCRVRLQRLAHDGARRERSGRLGGLHRSRRTRPTSPITPGRGRAAS